MWIYTPTPTRFYGVVLNYLSTWRALLMCYKEKLCFTMARQFVFDKVMDWAEDAILENH
jgi:hypothetical protein